MHRSQIPFLALPGSCQLFEQVIEFLLQALLASFLTAAGDNNAGTFVSECQRGGASDSREGSANKASGSSCAPSPMEKALPRREYNLVRKQTDDDDDKHDADNLVHRI